MIMGILYPNSITLVPNYPPSGLYRNKGPGVHLNRKDSSYCNRTTWGIIRHQIASLWCLIIPQVVCIEIKVLVFISIEKIVATVTGLLGLKIQQKYAFWLHIHIGGSYVSVNMPPCYNDVNMIVLFYHELHNYVYHYYYITLY